MLDKMFPVLEDKMQQRSSSALSRGSPHVGQCCCAAQQELVRVRGSGVGGIWYLWPTRVWFELPESFLQRGIQAKHIVGRKNVSVPETMQEQNNGGFAMDNYVLLKNL